MDGWMDEIQKYGCKICEAFRASLKNNNGRFVKYEIQSGGGGQNDLGKYFQNYQAGNWKLEAFSGELAKQNHYKKLQQCKF